MAKTTRSATFNSTPKPANHALSIPKPVLTKVKKVLILGAECTGKSTLAQDLGAYFTTPIVNEYMRTYLTEKPSNYTCQWVDLLPIAVGQMIHENQAVSLAETQNLPYVFCDTGLFEIMVYSHWYFNACPKEIEQHANQYRYDLVLLTDNFGIQWVADTMRDLPNGHDKMHQTFVKFLNAHRMEFVAISGNRKQRVQNVVNLLAKL
ncbi:NAD metabolism ATPase/kinase-like protein [Moraxella macacae 0408225]|uniref:NAD metabolism ATPase/kinase-like protein n=1 Tax=Moraxella macacae 0408225 TaxID=1230338 RepID=L2F6U2_9GAMM|nr:ATP-binding protein [Moraxella macacae]ELA08506.1 NAD metabolism ATPase/kinase-like protein [Moraxella macacae 0408225]